MHSSVSLSRLIRSTAFLFFLVALALPRTSFAYGLKRTATGQQIRWARNSVALRIDPALEQMLSPGGVRAAATMASDSWRGFAGVPDVMIEAGAPPAYDPNRRGNAIYLVRDWPFADNQLAVTLVTFEETGNILGVDILVNGSKQFALLSEPAAMPVDHYDIAAVLTHELGHVLGLDESFKHPEATMWPQIGIGEFRQRVLSADDEQGVIAVYEAPMPKYPSHGCTVGLASTQRTNGTWPGALAVLGATFWTRRVRRTRRPV